MKNWQKSPLNGWIVHESKSNWINVEMCGYKSRLLLPFEWSQTVFNTENKTSNLSLLVCSASAIQRWIRCNFNHITEACGLLPTYTYKCTSVLTLIMAKSNCDLCGQGQEMHKLLVRTYLPFLLSLPRLRELLLLQYRHIMRLFANEKQRQCKNSADFRQNFRFPQFNYTAS